MAQSLYQPYAVNLANTYGIRPGLLTGLITQESRWNPSALGPVNWTGERAIGLGQLLPSTASGLGVNPYDPFDNLKGSAMYLNQMLGKYGGDERLALMAYNWGPGNVDSWSAGGANPNRVPSETRNYIDKVLIDFNPDATSQTKDCGTWGWLNSWECLFPESGKTIDKIINDPFSIEGIQRWLVRGVFIILGFILIFVALWMLGNRSKVVVAVKEKIADKAIENAA